MPHDKPDMPHTQTSAPVEPPETAEDVASRREPDAGRPPRQAGDESGRGDRMPKGADEPGAGM